MASIPKLKQDQFSFDIETPAMNEGDKIKIAVCFRTSGQEFWDNNNGKNYTINCVELYASCYDERMMMYQSSTSLK